jgi:DNA-binding GntR family transcriptional regulator
MKKSMQLEITARTLGSRVADIIAASIIDGTFVGGQRLTAAEVAERLGVSRTPVREAFMLLHEKRLLEKDSSRSFKVAVWTDEDLSEVAQLRVALEALAIELVIHRITPDDFDLLESLVMQMEGAFSRGEYTRYVELDLRFHSALWRVAGNSRLQQVLEDLKIQVSHFMSITQPGDEQEYPATHRDLISALKSGDSDSAQSVMRAHILSTADRVMARVKSDVVVD